jgi:hypothetical protein
MRRFALISLLTLTAVSTASAKGQPSLRATLPADHTEGLRRGGFMLVHGNRHAERFPLTLTGAAEGIVNGRRTSVPLTFVRDTLDGSLMLITKTWPDGGAWVLNIGGGYDSTRTYAGIVIGINRQGVPVLVQNPRSAMGGTRPASRREVAQLLAHLNGDRAEAPALVHGPWRILFTGRGAFLLLLAALPVLYVAHVVQRARRQRALNLAPAR